MPAKIPMYAFLRLQGDRSYPTSCLYAKRDHLGRIRRRPLFDRVRFTRVRYRPGTSDVDQSHDCRSLSALPQQTDARGRYLAEPRLMRSRLAEVTQREQLGRMRGRSPPVAACCALAKRSSADLAERLGAAFRRAAKIEASVRRPSVLPRCSREAAASFRKFPPCAGRHRGRKGILGSDSLGRPLDPLYSREMVTGLGTAAGLQRLPTRPGQPLDC